MPRNEADGPIHQRRSLENMELFLETLATTGMVTKAAGRIGISTNTAHKWRNLSRANPKDPRFLIEDPLGDSPPTTFAEAWQEAVNAACDVVESSLVELATGYWEPVIHKGQFCYEVDTSGDPMRAKDGSVLVDKDGNPIYPLKLDADGKPIQVLVRKKDVRAQQTFLKARHRDYKEKVELDVTSGGKPLGIPQRGASVEDFMANFGRPMTDEEKARLDGRA